MSTENSQYQGEPDRPLTRRELRERERQQLAQRLREQTTGPVAVQQPAPEPEPTEASAPTPAPTREPEPAEREPDPVAEIFDETIDARPAKKRRHDRRGGMGCIVAFLTVAVLAGLLWLGWTFVGDRVLSFLGLEDNDFEGTGNGVEVEVSVLPGDTGTTIAERLEEDGVIKDADKFVEEALSRPDEPEFHPGTYLMQEEMSAAAALDTLLDENARLDNKVVIPEGTRAQDVYQLIEADIGISAADLEAAAADPAAFGLPEQAQSLEGFLFPATYEFEPGSDPKAVLQTMVDRTYQALAEAGVPAEQTWDVIRMASLVQVEARIEEDFYKVARVFYNRIDAGMHLQSDATVAYGSGNTHRVETTDAEREDASNPFNTYVHEGLPVGPISNPGDLAIDAALHPADGDWLYFVAVNLETGETVFSTTIEEHEAAVQQWLQWMEEHPDYQ